MNRWEAINTWSLTAAPPAFPAETKQRLYQRTPRSSFWSRHQTFICGQTRCQSFSTCGSGQSTAVRVETWHIRDMYLERGHRAPFEAPGMTPLSTLLPICSKPQKPYSLLSFSWRNKQPDMLHTLKKGLIKAGRLKACSLKAGKKWRRGLKLLERRELAWGWRAGQNQVLPNKTNKSEVKVFGLEKRQLWMRN